ncbi:MAG: DUF748 domain-containing protein [Bacteroidetes bacterium]|nr:DUF748 domain-containing protein [Bacteroidota bacterium]
MKLHPRKKRSLRKIALYSGIVTGAILVFFFFVFLIFRDPLINWYAKDAAASAFAKAYPGHTIQLGDLHYSVWENRLVCDSVSMLSVDSSVTGNLTAVSIRGMDWLALLWHQEATSEIFAQSRLDIDNLVLRFYPSGNEWHCQSMRVSIPDSVVAADSSQFFSTLETEEFFARSPDRQTRFTASIPIAVMSGINFRSILKGDSYQVRSIAMRDAFADILVNMDKPYRPDSLPPKMLNEVFVSIQQDLSIESITITNGRLKYGERVTVRGVPGIITFDSVNVSVRGISNQSEEADTMQVIADGIFMNAAPMKLSLTMPLTSDTFSLNYSGSLGSMDATVLNAFLEPCEHVRITSGKVKTARYAVSVINGRARGEIDVIYDELELSILDKKTGSANGLWDQIASLYGYLFVIRGDNQRDGDGMLKKGKVRYRRHTEDLFLQYLWFSLRSGVADIVGFPEEE